MKIQISIIIPVFNIEKYLLKNIKTLLAIKRENIEFIYVNDGSTDRSEEILKEYEKKDFRVKIITQKNAGLSAARNAGIKASVGEWILFVDGDDWIDSKLTEKLFNAIEPESDMIWGGYEIVNEKEQVEKKVFLKNGDNGEIRDGIEWMISNKIMYTPWIYLYKSELLKKNRILFPEGLLHEDMEFLPKVFYYAKRVKYVAFPFYKYVNRAGSISRTRNVKRSQDLIQIAVNLEKFEKKYVGDSKCHLWYKGYRGEICAAAIHIAFLDQISFSDIFEDNLNLKKIMIKYLRESTRKKDRIAGAMLLWKLENLYKFIYLKYNKIWKKKSKGNY